MKDILLDKAIQFVGSRLISIKAASTILGVCKGTVYYRIDTGKLKVYHVAGYPFLLLKDIK